MTNEDPDDLEVQQAVLAVLLEEAHGAWQPRDVTPRVLARYAVGAGPALAARPHEVPTPWSVARGRPWLLAAMILLGIGVLFGVAVLRPQPQQAPVQEPDGGTQEPLPVRSLDELRALLPQVESIELEVLRLQAVGLPVAIDIAGVPLHLTAEDRQRVTTALADTRLEQPAGWDWPNHLSLHLRGQRRVEMAVDTISTGARLRLGLRGLQGDLSVGGDGAAVLRELIATATRGARLAHGIVLSRRDLEGGEAFPVSTAAMWLFGLVDADLSLLTRFAALRSLDLSGLAKVLTIDGLHRVCALPQVQRLELGGWRLDAARRAELVGDAALCELVLDDCDVTDDDVAALAKARGAIKTLSLRNNKRLTTRALEAALKLPALRLLDVRGSGDQGKIVGDDATAIAAFLRPEVEVRL